MSALEMDQVKELLSKKKDKKFRWSLLGAVLAVAALITVVFLLKRKEEEDWDEDDFDDEDWDDEDDAESKDEDSTDEES